MKQSYKFSDGKTTEIEVNSAVAELLASFAREDENAARKERWRNEVSIEAMNEETGWEPIDTTVNIEADYIAGEEKEILLAAISHLSEKQQRLVRLYYYEEKTMLQIADELGVSKMAVSLQLTTIKGVLKKYFEKFSD